MKTVKKILGVREIYKNYDIFILDQWGVMHDGTQGYVNAIKCVEELFKHNKKLIIISNSSKRSFSSHLRLPELGFKKTFFEEVMTSGEMIWQSLLNEEHNETYNIGKKCYHIFDETKEDGIDYLKGLEKYNYVKNIEDADFILGCTPFANSKILDFIPILNKAIKKDIPFICANPDLYTVKNNMPGNEFCMGSISELYKAMGGHSFILGKPSLEIYKKSIEKIKNIKKSKILAIGDSIDHDIKGANNFNIDSLLITRTGIHKDLFDDNNPNWYSTNNNYKKNDIKPSFICSELIF